MLYTYGSPDPLSPTGITQGGYSTDIVVEEDYAISILDSIGLERAGPLLCAGITTCLPLLNNTVQQGDRIGVAGIGGLGHLAVKLAVSRGAEVYAFTTTESKVDDLLSFGAEEAVVVDSPEALQPYYRSLGYLISTIAVPYELGAYVPLVRPNGTYTQVGILGEDLSFNQNVFVFNRVQYEGWLTGGIPQTQAPVEYCAANGIHPEIEMIDASEVNDAWENVVRDVRSVARTPQGGGIIDKLPSPPTSEQRELADQHGVRAIMTNVRWNREWFTAITQLIEDGVVSPTLDTVLAPWAGTGRSRTERGETRPWEDRSESRIARSGRSVERRMRIGATLDRIVQSVSVYYHA